MTGNSSHVMWVPITMVWRVLVGGGGADGGDSSQIWRVSGNIINKQSRTVDRGWSSSFVVGRGANTFSP
jgi:hypothetical protein